MTESVAIIVKVVQEITRQRDTITSRHEVVRAGWLDWRLGENYNKWKEIIHELQIGCGRKAVMPEDVGLLWIIPKRSAIHAYLFRPQDYEMRWMT